jgi:5-methyltetrahydrofolate--homocysteine methyltransferase
VDAVAFHLVTMGRQELRLPGGGSRADGDPANIEDHFALGYRGTRFFPCYGAFPDLVEEYQLHPEQSTDI